MNEHHYSYRIFWSEPDTCYVAMSPEFPHLSALADTAAEALAEFEEVLKTSLDLYAEESWTLPEPRTWTGDAVQQTVSGLALASMQQTLDRGKSIEIPSLGIVIYPDKEADDDKPI